MRLKEEKICEFLIEINIQFFIEYTKFLKPIGIGEVCKMTKIFSRDLQPSLVRT